MNKIAAIVVTYNRKNYLKTCLEAITKQIFLPDVIYIVDNHSTDYTSGMLLENQYITNIPDADVAEDSIVISRKNNLLIKYIYKSENTGGAGGFYAGMKMAYDDGYEWLWMMDDDGVPADDSLEKLFFYSQKHNLHFANPLVINIEDRFSLSFGLLAGKNNKDDYQDMDIVYDIINPFNGSFINRIVPQQIGFVKKEMFIWGDEREYQRRTMKNNFTVASVTKSIHYHPKFKGNIINVFPYVNRFKVQIKPENFSQIFYRNQGYIDYTYNKLYFLKTFLKYILCFIFRFKILECMRFCVSYINGSRNIFN